MSTDVHVPEWKENPDTEGLWVRERRWKDTGECQYVMLQEVIFVGDFARLPVRAPAHLGGDRHCDIYDGDGEASWWFGPIPPLTTQEDHK